jgi:ABC-type Fe3+-siderophore transport system permease subunit
VKRVWSSKIGIEVELARVVVELVVVLVAGSLVVLVLVGLVVAHIVDMSVSLALEGLA